MCAFRRGGGCPGSAPSPCRSPHGQVRRVLRPWCPRLYGGSGGSRGGGPPAPGRSAASHRPDRSCVRTASGPRAFRPACGVAGRSGRCGPGGAVPHRRCPGSMPTAPPSAPGGPLCHHRLVLYVHASSTNLFSPRVQALPVCCTLGWKGKRGRDHGRGGGIKDDPDLGLEGCGGAVSQATGDSCFCPGGLPPGGPQAGGCARPAPRTGWKGALSAAPVCSPRPRSPALSPPLRTGWRRTPRAPVGRLCGVGARGREWREAPPSPPQPRRQGPDSEWGALTVPQLLTDPRVPHGASCYGGRGAAAGLRRPLCCLPCVQPRAGGQRAAAL